jgi:hypothetical protein
MTGGGFRTFTAGEVLTAARVQDFFMDQAVMNFNGTAARGSALPSPSTGMVAHIGGGTVQVYNGTAWVALGGVPNAVLSNTATGTYSAGTPSVNYAYYEFTASGTATVTTPGLADILIVAGGAGGMASGGGAGGLLNITNAYLTGSLTVTIGAGGPGYTAVTTSMRGNKSSIGNFIALSGGPANDNNNFSSAHYQGGTHGSTGGSNNTLILPNDSSQGNAGVSAANSGVYGGGGGAGGTGSATTAGPGLASSITGNSVTYGRGGTALNGSPTPVAGTANRGDGGGGASGFAGFAGGSGIVIIRVRT